MWLVIRVLLRVLHATGKQRPDLVLENLALRHQLAATSALDGARRSPLTIVTCGRRSLAAGQAGGMRSRSSTPIP
jgi:hypothetical protein